MAKYKFPQFNIEITDPVIAVKSVQDDLETKTCIVFVKLITETVTYIHTLPRFSYDETWADVEINDWANQELIKFEV